MKKAVNTECIEGLQPVIFAHAELDRYWILTQG